MRNPRRRPQMLQPPRHSAGAPEHSPLSEALLLGGEEIRIRLLSRRDHAGVASLFSRLISESRYRRFFGPKRELADREPVFFTGVDHVRHEAVAALDQRVNSVVGVARE